MQTIYTDGSGDGRMAWYNETTKEMKSDREDGMTNNEAEYTAVIRALETVEDKDVKIMSDSKLVVNQLKGEWHIKGEQLRKLFDTVHDIIKKRELNVEFVWVPREENPAGKYLG